MDKTPLDWIGYQVLTNLFRDDTGFAQNTRNTSLHMYLVKKLSIFNNYYIVLWSFHEGNNYRESKAFKRMTTCSTICQVDRAAYQWDVMFWKYIWCYLLAYFLLVTFTSGIVVKWFVNKKSSFVILVFSKVPTLELTVWIVHNWTQILSVSHTNSWVMTVLNKRNILFQIKYAKTTSLQLWNF